MLKLKSGQSDFLSNEIRRILKYLGDAKYDCATKIQKIEQITDQMDDLRLSNPNASLEDIRSNPELWRLIQEALGSQV
jgi:hypothetical protein